MQVDIMLKNYRCFPDHKPARISLRKGFTAFVGANNSGKSSMLKFFYEFRQLFEQLADQSAFYKALRGRERVFHFAPSVRDLAEVFCNTTTRDLEIEFQFTTIRSITAPRLQLTEIPVRLVVTVPRNRNTWKASFRLDNELLPPDETALNVAFKGSELHYGGRSQVDMGGFFSFLKALSNTLYIGAFRNAINIGSTEDYFDIQVGQAFVRAWRQYKTGDRKRDNEAAIKLTKDISGIFGFEELEINPSSDDQTLQVMINGRSYRLNELGSGLAQFIIVLANVAVKRPSYILIDEPELNLHPSLQLDFLTTLTSYAKEGILFATHSIGLARACAEQVYSFCKIAEGESEVAPYEATPRLSEFLGELSFSGLRRFVGRKLDWRPT
jgi:hypothetical protein